MFGSPTFSRIWFCGQCAPVHDGLRAMELSREVRTGLLSNSGICERLWLQLGTLWAIPKGRSLVPFHRLVRLGRNFMTYIRGDGWIPPPLQLTHSVSPLVGKRTLGPAIPSRAVFGQLHGSLFDSGFCFGMPVGGVFWAFGWVAFSALQCGHSRQCSRVLSPVGRCGSAPRSRLAQAGDPTRRNEWCRLGSAGSRSHFGFGARRRAALVVTVLWIKSTRSANAAPTGWALACRSVRRQAEALVGFDRRGGGLKRHGDGGDRQY